MRSLGLYIHIPFCKAKCIYCDFYSLPRAEGQMDAYVSALTAQLAAWRERTADCTVDTVYFGGGTPSYLGPDCLCRLLDAVFQSYRVAPGAEITLEANPDSAQDISALRQLHDAGFDRLSLGMQSADDAELRRIGRVHTYAQTVRAVENARAAGFDNLSLDLIYGLPEQTMTRWQANLDAALSLAPEHLSCYGLKLEPGTKMYEDYYGSPILPDDDEQADMYCYAAELLERYGYKQYEISNFCAPGYESRHNMKYWTLEDYMGFGPGAHSCVGNLRYSYVRDLKQYIAGVGRGVSIVDEYETIEPLERAVEYIMLGMRTAHGISERDYRVRCQYNWKPIGQTLQAFAEKGWAEKTGDRWHFTVPGYLISNTLIGILLEAQAGGRIEGTPWLSEVFEAEKKINIPKSEEELFTELYNQHTEKN